MTQKALAALSRIQKAFIQMEAGVGCTPEYIMLANIDENYGATPNMAAFGHNCLLTLPATSRHSGFCSIAVIHSNSGVTPKVRPKWYRFGLSASSIVVLKKHGGPLFQRLKNRIGSSIKID